MTRYRAAPAPGHVSINNSLFALALDERGSPQFRKEIPPDPQDPARGELTRIQNKWDGGVGHKRAYGNPELDRGIFMSVAGDTGGGVDGSWGPLVGAPKTTSVTVSAGDVIRAGPITFAGKYVLAADNLLISSDTGLFGDATTVLTNDSNITGLTIFQGSNGVNRLVIFQQHGPIRTTADLSTFTIDGDTAGQSGKATWVGKTTDNGATYTDVTNNLGDSQASTVMTLSSLDTLANGDFFIVLFELMPFYSCTFTIGSANANASVLATHYWDGDSWETLTNVDGTASGGATMAVTGTVSWSRPASTWPRARISNGQQTRTGYAVRFSVSAALDSSVTVTTLSLKFNFEGDRGAVSGDRLAIMRGNRMYFTTNGGTAPTWFSNADPIGDDKQTSEGIGAAAGAVYAKLSHVFGTNENDGRPLPVVSFPNGLTNTGDQAFTSWEGDGRIYFSHENAFYSFDPLSGYDVVGPERMFVNEDAVASVRFTSCIGDRTHFLYAAGWDGTNATLWKLGSYRLTVNPDSGQPEYQRFDSWHTPIAKLSTSKVRSMGTYTLSSQPYLFLGDEAGVLRYLALPKGVSGLAHGSGYLFATDVDCHAVLMSEYGHDESRPLVVKRGILTGRQISGNSSVTLWTKTPGESNWTSRITFTDSDGDEQAFTTAYAGRGIDQRLTLRTNSAASLTTNLVGWWELSESSGNATDSLGTTTLTDTNTVGSATGVGGVGTSRDFNGTTEYFTAADNATLSMGNIDFAVCAWVYLDVLGATHTILGKWQPSGNDREYILGVESSNLASWNVSANGSTSTSVTASTFGALEAGRWYFLYAYHDATADTIGISVNDGTVNTAPHTTGGRDGTAAFRIGVRNNDTNYLNGRVQRAGVWKKVLSAAEVTFLYASGKSVGYSFTAAQSPIVDSYAWRYRHLVRGTAAVFEMTVMATTDDPNRSRTIDDLLDALEDAAEEDTVWTFIDPRGVSWNVLVASYAEILLAAEGRDQWDRAVSLTLASIGH